MDQETPNFTPELPRSLVKRMGKRRLLLGLALILVVLGVVLVLALGGRKGQKTDNQARAPKTLTTTFGEKAFRYAGTPQYDACGLLTLDTVQTHVKSYLAILGNLGTDQISSDPLTLEHVYLDRDSARAVGTDGRPRATGNSAGPSAFGSVFDSNCVYGQGGEVGKRMEFARVFVTQNPTPLSKDFLSYVASIADKKQTVGALDLYPVPPTAGDTFYSVIMVKHDKSLAVLLRAANKELAAAGADEIGTKLETAPKGPMHISYPAPYAHLINACTLLSAPDFQQFTGKPPSALAQETLYLTDVNALTVAEELHPVVSGVRQCQRLEVDRSANDNIAQTRVVLRQFRNQASAKKYVTDLKNDDLDGLTIVPSKTGVKGADEAYSKVETNPNPAVSGYTFEMRLGATVISLSVESDTLRADKSAVAYEMRVLPAAQLVADNYRKQIK